MTSPVFTVASIGNCPWNLSYSYVKIWSDGEILYGAARSKDKRTTEVASMILAGLQGGTYIPPEGTFLSIKSDGQYFSIWEVSLKDKICTEKGTYASIEFALGAIELMNITEKKRYVPGFWGF